MEAQFEGFVVGGVVLTSDVSLTSGVDASRKEVPDSIMNSIVGLISDQKFQDFNTIIQAFPDSIYQTWERQSLLEISIRRKSSPQIILAILAKNRNASTMMIEGPTSLLHLAIDVGCSDEVIFPLMEASPDKMSIKDWKGNLPLNYAVTRGGSWSLIEKLTEKLTESNPDYINAIRLAIYSEASNAVMMKLLEKFPDAALIVNSRGDYLLHDAALYCGGEVISALLKLNREAILHVNRSGKNPLNNAIQHLGELKNKYGCYWNNGNPGSIYYAECAEAIDVLLVANPSSASKIDANKSLPLNHAILYHAPTSVICSLLKAYPEGALHRGFYGKTALHDAADAWYFEIVEELMEAYPEAALIRDDGDRLPIHRALLKGMVHQKNYELMLSKYPQLVKEEYEGCFPLHLAFQSGEPLEVIKLMICSEAASHEFKYGRCQVLPLHAALERNCPDLVIVILAAYPDAAKVCGQDGRMPIDIAVEKEMPLEVVGALYVAQSK